MATTIDLTNYNATVDDDGTNLVGTLIDKAKLASVLLTPMQTAVTALDAVDATKAGLPGVSTITTTGTSTALALPTGTGNLVIVANNATLLTVQGIVAGTDGQQLTIISKGAGQVDFAHLHASGTALGKLKLFATVGLTSLAAGVGVAVFQYDATVTQWRLVNHEQGGWITRTFAAGNYTASAGTWTVASAGRDAFWLKGRTLAYSFSAGGTTSGTPVTVKIAIPGSYVAAASDGNSYYVSLNGAGGGEGGYWQSTGGGGLLNFQRYANVAFAAGTVSLIGVMQFEVQ